MYMRHHVPTLGPVAWSTAEVDDYAAELLRTHRPVRRGAGGWLLRRRPLVCGRCGGLWACPDAMWALGWMTSLDRTLALDRE